MGLYTYITEADRINMRKVDDLELNEVFKEALKHDPTLMLSQTTYNQKRLFRKPLEYIHYTVYHEVLNNKGNPTYEARQVLVEQLSASSYDKKVILAYLYGIINGSIHAALYKKLVQTENCDNEFVGVVNKEFWNLIDEKK